MIATNVSRSCSVRIREVVLSMYWAMLVPGDGKGNAGLAGGAGQTAATLD